MSTTCNVCGSADFDLIDGFYYCTVCSTQSQVQREFEMVDDQLAENAAVAIAVKLTKKREKKGKKQKGVKPELTKEEEFMLPAKAHEDYEDVLMRPGLRLATYTKLLSRYCDVLIQQYNVPECVRKHALNILQQYLRHFKIAFCEEEINEEESYSRLMRNLEYDSQMRAREEEDKRRKEAALAEGTGDIFSQLTSGDFDANLSAQITKADQEKNREEIQLVIEKRTKLSFKAVETLSHLPLNLEFLIIMLYMASMCAGATWILISDITRWFREGRFMFTYFHRFSLLPNHKFSVDDDETKVYARLRVVSIYPLYEYVRSVFALSQICNIPVQPIENNFEKLLSRMCFNLNLPHVFGDRVRALSILFTPYTQFDSSLVHRFGTFSSSEFMKFTFSNYYQHILRGFDGETYAVSSHRPFTQSSVLPSLEVKAMVIILFALKLMFGLDGNREYNMVPEEGSSSTFNFTEWLQQLKLRMLVWRGRPLKSVLEKRRTPFPTYQEWDVDPPEKRYMHCLEGFRIGWQKDIPRECTRFKGCVPNYDMKEEREYAMYSVFADDIEPRPAEYLDSEALYAPLRYQATRNKEWYENYLESEALGGINTEAMQIDRWNTDVFFKRFKNCSMSYKETTAEVSGNVKNAEGMCSSEAERKRWRHLFPSSSCYKSSPRPIYSHLLMRISRRDSVYDPLIYAKALDNILKNARQTMSSTFEYLLEAFSVIIGEEQKVFYAFFLMLEMQCLMSETLRDLKKLVKEGAEITTCAFLGRLTGSSYLTNITLRRIMEDVAPPDFRYEVVFIEALVEEDSAAGRLNPRVSRKRRKAAQNAIKNIHKMFPLQPLKKHKRRSRRMSNIASGEEPTAATTGEPISADCEGVTSGMNSLLLDNETGSNSDSCSSSSSTTVIDSGHKRSRLGNWSFRPGKTHYERALALEFEIAFALNIFKYW